ncbi:DUF6445 family protein [Sphingomonas sp.]|uniref:DUF6445 family protein n=1 Tax=Sphingomonas sp. TaxID=28214 RepID=UPI0025E17279|nr:DUF6445 family protein [Sphingomonas sp.]MBV9529033.1 hypothetical protein [Sphingomonas sp.]
MKPELRRVGNERIPVVVIDDFSGDAEAVGALADALAPFPDVRRGYYPGVRRVIGRADADADAYVERTCRDAAQFIAGAFDVESFDLVEASFSMVTAQPSQLRPPQRAPHFDSTEPAYLALLHYLRVPAGTGTAFYRQRPTGIEQVSDANVDRFVAAARLVPGEGYIRGSNEYYEQIGAVEAVPDRLVIYPGNLLHSGIIPPDMAFSDDPRVGRLTANFFVRGHRGQ